MDYGTFTKDFTMGLVKFRFEYTNDQYFNNVEFFFASFKDYLDEVDGWISKELGKAAEKLRKFEEELEKDPRWEDEWFIHHDELRQKTLLRVIYYESLILTIYSFTEKQMVFICKKLEPGLQMSWTMLQGRVSSNAVSIWKKSLELISMRSMINGMSCRDLIRSGII